MYRIGKKQNRAILTADGKEVVIFAKGKEALAEKVCKLLNADKSSSPQNEPLAIDHKSIALTPFRCPVCFGVGRVQSGFYNNINGCGTTSSLASTEECRSCMASGIVWG